LDATIQTVCRQGTHVRLHEQEKCKHRPLVKINFGSHRVVDILYNNNLTIAIVGLDKIVMTMRVRGCGLGVRHIVLEWLDMRKSYIVLGTIAVLVFGVGAAAYVVSPPSHVATSGEAPELGRTGSFPIGTEVSTITLANRGQITATSTITGRVKMGDRSLSVRYWYPAVPATGQSTPVSYPHEFRAPGKPALTVVSKGIATASAQPVQGQKFPLVLMSHGYGGWDTQISNLGEHIASRGYIVASIDHKDMPVASAGDFLLSFGNVLADRSLDQRQVLDQIADDVAAKRTPYLGGVDLNNVAILGYSMGGYGAISTAGAPYDYKAGPLAKMPRQSQETMRAAPPSKVAIKALIAFSPWGGQPDSRAFDGDGLSKITIPVLLVAGNQDDVVNFKDGVSWLFNALTSAPRYMLVYREARHNIIGNAFELGDNTPFSTLEFLSEPVWRSERLNAINQHFVAAFLDMTLKGDAAKRLYFDVPTVDSNSAEWPLSFAEQTNGAFAGAKQEKYWRGFQRRWATGLELHHLAPGAPTPSPEKKN
jgi:predicted dienelactone hydrolase